MDGGKGGISPLARLLRPPKATTCTQLHEAGSVHLRPHAGGANRGYLSIQQSMQAPLHEAGGATPWGHRAAPGGAGESCASGHARLRRGCAEMPGLRDRGVDGGAANSNGRPWELEEKASGRRTPKSSSGVHEVLLMMRNGRGRRRHAALPPAGRVETGVPSPAYASRTNGAHGGLPSTSCSLSCMKSSCACTEAVVMHGRRALPRARRTAVCVARQEQQMAAARGSSGHA